MTKLDILLVRNAKKYDFGGGERYPVFLAQELQKLGTSAAIVSAHKGLTNFAKDSQVKIIKGWWWSFQNWSGKFALLFPVYVLWQIVLFLYYLIILSRYQPHTIHIQSKDDFIAGTFAGRTLGKRVVWTDHADLKHIFKNISLPYKNPTGKLVYLAARLADVITVVSKSEYELVTRHIPNGSPVKDKIKVVYNGVADSFKPPSPKKNSGEFEFLIASRLVTDKGLGEAITAFKWLSKDFRNIRLTILGTGPEEEKFKELARGDENIRFLGYKTDPLNYMGNCDVFLQPTYHEGFSVALVEASMLGLPIITTSVGGNVEIIKNKKTGLLVAPKDTDALYDAMLILSKDKSLRQKLAKAARKNYEDNYIFSKIVNKDFIPLYSSKGA